MRFPRFLMAGISVFVNKGQSRRPGQSLRSDQKTLHGVPQAMEWGKLHCWFIAQKGASFCHLRCSTQVAASSIQVACFSTWAVMTYRDPSQWEISPGDSLALDFPSSLLLTQYWRAMREERICCTPICGVFRSSAVHAECRVRKSPQTPQG